MTPVADPRVRLLLWWAAWTVLAFAAGVLIMEGLR